MKPQIEHQTVKRLKSLEDLRKCLSKVFKSYESLFYFCLLRLSCVPLSSTFTLGPPPQYFLLSVQLNIK